MPDKVLLWDIDGTIVRGSLERLFFKELQKWKRDFSRGRIFPKALVLALSSRMRWYRLKLVYLRGQSVREVDKWLDSWFDSTVKDIIYPAVERVIVQLNESGRNQVLLSGTPKPLAERLAALLGLKNVIAAEPEVLSGYYTGRLLTRHPFGPEKVSQAALWLNVNSINWQQTIALANHWDDRFLLEHVSIPVAINPDIRLKKLAIERDWVIVPDVTDFKGKGIDEFICALDA